MASHLGAQVAIIAMVTRWPCQLHRRLIRAANEIDALTPFERVRLIERAAATIRSQRDFLTMRERAVPLSFDVTADLDKMKSHASEMTEVLSAVVMPKCGDETRRLRILLDTEPR
ncbi:hypothetical protein HNQ75_001959 [Rhizobium flavum]|uniref:Uncharacterized protein n=2 Tax=Pseudorhizobium flavum TaxID=1335061 RepID=A0A7X0DDD5_9HYPH|nr:hypothetical protein [Pseudorhizobium flavum]MBB6179991.1 hypothetical protein [Pseudorhizobium flavum]CAD6598759.1 hypothetical protein RFYW14_00611 [Pseudorhizobium flavum]